jgi:hypothetical protein
MRTATSNLFILDAEIGTTTISGKAIDGDISVNFAVANTEINQRLFISEAQLVVTGKFRLAAQIATIGIWIDKVIAVVSIPEPAPVEVAPTLESEPALTHAVAVLTPAQKRAATIAANKAAAAVELVEC